MARRRRMSFVTLLLMAVAAGVAGIKFSIDAQVDQIFRIIEKSQMAIETSDMKMVMTPADFNFIVPFTVKMTCSNGLMIVQDMRRIHQEDIYMDAINDNETYISVRFTVSEMDFKYELCWLSLIIPVPLWLRGKILQSTYYVTSKISYDPTCEFTIIKASLESYEKMSLNVFNWLPGGLGDAMTEMLTRNTQDRIYDTVSKSIEKTLMKLSTVYDACVGFPAMGRLRELPQQPDELVETEETDDPLLTVAERDEYKDNELSSENEVSPEPTFQVNENEQTQIPVLVETQRVQPDPTTSTESSTTVLNDGGSGKDVLGVNGGQHSKMHLKETNEGSTVQINEHQVRMTAKDAQQDKQCDQADCNDTAFNDDGHVTENKCERQNKNKDCRGTKNDSNEIATEYTKTKPVESEQPPNYYEIIRSQIIAKESVEKACLIDERKGVENKLPDELKKDRGFSQTDFGNMKRQNYERTVERNTKITPKKLKCNKQGLKGKELKEFQMKMLKDLDDYERRSGNYEEKADIGVAMLHDITEERGEKYEYAPSGESRSKIEM